MTVVAVGNRISYSGDGSTTSFAYPFDFFDSDEITVYLKNTTTEVETLQVLNTNYSVSRPSTERPDSGSVVFTVAPPSGQTVIIVANPTVEQPLDLTETGPLSSESIEDILDRVTILSSYSLFLAGRAVRQKDTDDSSVALEIPSGLTHGDLLYINAAGTGLDRGPGTPAERADGFLGFDAAGDPVIKSGGIANDVTVTPFAETLLDDASAQVMRETLGINGELLKFASDAEYVSTNGAAQDGDTYYNTTDDVVRVHQNGAWQTAGSGGGGGGTGINFIPNENFDADASGVATYKDAALSTPEDGTGGTANITAVRSEVDPLRGDGSLLITKDAASRQGEGVAMAFTVARGYRNQRFRVAFAYEVKSGTFAQDIEVFIYDVTNGVLISPEDRAIPAQSGVFQTVFNTTDSTSYLLLLHVASTSSAAWSIAVDDVQVGPGGVVSGAALSGWEAFTPTGNVSTNVTYTGLKRRVGDTWQYRVLQTFSGATDTVSRFTLNIVDGAINTAKRLTSQDAVEVYGNARLYDSSGSIHELRVSYNNTTSVGLRSLGDSSGSIISGDADTTNPITIANGDLIFWDFEVPISGLSTNLITSNNKVFRIAESYSMTRVTAAPTKLGEYRSQRREAGAATFIDTSATPSVLPSAANGFQVYSGNAYASADSVNEPTRYEVFIGKNKAYQVQWYATTGRTGYIDATPDLNGTADYGWAESYDPSTGVLLLTGSLKAGSGRSAHVGAVGSDGGTSVSDPYFDVVVSDAPGIAFGLDEWKAVVALASGDAPSASAGNPVIYPTVQFDTHGGYNATTGRYTVPYTGYYRVSTAIISTDNNRQMFVHKNAVAERFIGTTDANGEGSLSALVQANAGDILDIRPSGGALDVGSAACYVSFERIGGAS